jgi:hypothetical protein
VTNPERIARLRTLLDAPAVVIPFQRLLDLLERYDAMTGALLPFLELRVGPANQQAIRQRWIEAVERTRADVRDRLTALEEMAVRDLSAPTEARH